MIVKEQIRIGSRDFIRTYSDANRFVVNVETGAEYVEAYDPAELHREYTEGKEIPVPPDEEDLSNVDYS